MSELKKLKRTSNYTGLYIEKSKYYRPANLESQSM